MFKDIICILQFLLFYFRLYCLSLSQEVKYKICVVGKSGVGKSATVANLCGLSIPNSHADTPGLQVNTTYWYVLFILLFIVAIVVVL